MFNEIFWKIDEFELNKDFSWATDILMLTIGNLVSNMSVTDQVKLLLMNQPGFNAVLKQSASEEVKALFENQKCDPLDLLKLL